MNTPKNQARGQNSHALHMNWYEFPDTDALESWTYTSEFTYQAGQRVDFHTSSTFDGYSIKSCAMAPGLRRYTAQKGCVGNVSPRL